MKTSISTKKTDRPAKQRTQVILKFIPVIICSRTSQSPPLYQFTQSCPTLCDPTDCITPALPVHHHYQSLLKLKSIESVMSSNHLILCRPFSSHLQSFPASGSFQMSQFLASGGQSIGVSASASVLPMNIQDWFPLGSALAPFLPKNTQG